MFYLEPARLHKNLSSRAITFENPIGESGKGGMILPMPPEQMRDSESAEE